MTIVAESSLQSALRGVAGLAFGRSILDKRLLSGGEEHFVAELDTIWRASARGHASARGAALGIASWIGHLLAESEGARLGQLGQVASNMGLDLAAGILTPAPPRARLLPRGRLAEVCLPVRHSFAFWTRVTTYERRNAVFWKSLQHPDPVYIARMLDQRWLREASVIEVASRRPTTDGIVLTIVGHDRWFARPPVHRAIVANPFSPAPLVLALLPLSPLRHLRAIVVDNKTRVGCIAEAVLSLRNAARGVDEEPSSRVGIGSATT